MKIGEITIVVEVVEDSPVFIDKYLIPLAVEIDRSEADVEYDGFIEEQIEELEVEIED
ncbi:hypothetical protein [Flagellimonas sp.]|uniref:hypothetical protein n=1 Tax=Flagellimonas sp. TaxID=2058762 RepID=UPI003BAFB93E